MTDASACVRTVSWAPGRFPTGGPSYVIRKAATGAWHTVPYAGFKDEADCSIS